ncbi:MAG: 50S ribosomal protein L10 [Saprospiraceae bacterium]|nr:50S ribosomal protein L10 [Saprospiraceae bacterium]
MNKAQKTQVIEDLKERFENSTFFYLTDASSLTVMQVNSFRKLCFEQNVQMQVVKNTLIKKALEAGDESKNYSDLYNALEGPTAVLFCETANIPARIIEKFRKTNSKPILKAAYIDSSVYVGDDQIEVLTKLKSKEELIGEIIGLLQSPAKNVVSALKSGGSTIAGLLKTLEERAN